MKDQPWYTYVLLLGIVFAFFYFLYFKPQNNKINNIREERTNIENQVVKLRAQRKQLNSLETELKSMTATLEQLEVIIPQQEEMYEILRRFQQLAYDTRLDIKKFDSKGLVNKEFYSEKPIAVEISGNYHNLAIFFDRLRNFSRLFIVENFSIKSVQNQSDDQTISANWTAKTFIFHEKPPTKKEEKRKPSPRKK